MEYTTFNAPEHQHSVCTPTQTAASCVQTEVAQMESEPATTRSVIAPLATIYEHERALIEASSIASQRAELWTASCEKYLGTISTEVQYLSGQAKLLTAAKNA